MENRVIVSREGKRDEQLEKALSAAMPDAPFVHVNVGPQSRREASDDQAWADAVKKVISETVDEMRQMKKPDEQ